MSKKLLFKKGEDFLDIQYMIFIAMIFGGNINILVILVVYRWVASKKSNAFKKA